MSVPHDIQHGERVRVWFGYRWWAGWIVENAKDNDRCIVVRTDEPVGKVTDYLDGFGLSVGNRSDEIELEKP